MQNSNSPIRLTQTVAKGGCAAKVAASELRSILTQVKFPPHDTNLLVDGAHFDDAAIYRINADLALVQTLDFFTPIVDSPYLFGQVATANALSDVYAMGGDPKTAMAILAFPLATLEQKVIVEILQGASDLLAEAKVNFVGGHSIDDDTLKFGLSVTGHVHPKRVWSNTNAQLGDVLILTKPLGTGTCMAALKRSELSEDQLQEPLRSMAQLNRVLDLLTTQQSEAIHAATDITGFGFCGHAQQLAKASKKTLQVDFSKIPLFPQTESCLKNGYLTKAHRTNAQYTQDHCQLLLSHDWQRLALYDPQTSGGLLLAVDPAFASQILHALQTRFPASNIIGQVTAASEHSLVVR